MKTFCRGDSQIARFNNYKQIKTLYVILSVVEVFLSEERGKTEER